MHGSFMHKMDIFEAKIILGLNPADEHTSQAVSLAHARVLGINDHKICQESGPYLSLKVN